MKNGDHLNIKAICNKISDHMLIGSVYDNVIIHTKYRKEPLKRLYNVVIESKHKMLYYKLLKKKYLKKCTQERPWEDKEKVFNSNKVWFMWLQGLDNAPPIIKSCYQSLKTNLPDKEIILIEENNLNDYVHLPDYIEEKYKKGIISRTHFSDLVRLELLINGGGTG